MAEDIQSEEAKRSADAMGMMAKLCGLREDFLTDLLFTEPNDWSFVVKAHALLESVVCQLLATHLRHPPLEYVLAQDVQMEQRIKILKSVGITDENERKMMRLLGKLRNNLVHNAQQTDFNFVEYFKNKDNRNNFVEAFATRWPDPIPGTNPPVSRADYILKKPRYAIWMSVMGVVGKSVEAKLKALYEENMRAALLGLMAPASEATPPSPPPSPGPAPESR